MKGVQACLPRINTVRGRQGVKLPAHSAGLPGNVISFYIVPLCPAYKAGLAEHVPVK